MTSVLLARRALLLVLGLGAGVLASLLLAGCARQDGNGIIGKWRAERLEVMSLKLPVGPEFEVTPSKAVMGGDLSVPIASITQHDNAVTLDTDSLIGMTFYFVEPDRIYLELPLLGRIYYQRVKEQPAASPVVATAAVSAPSTSPQPALEVQSAPAAAERGYAQDYAQASSLAKHGDLDGAVRALNDAFKHGFRDTAQLSRSREFDVLRTDVRYQALLERYTQK